MLQFSSEKSMSYFWELIELLSSYLKISHMAYFEVTSMCYTTHVRDSTMCALKISGSSWQNEFSWGEPERVQH